MLNYGLRPVLARWHLELLRWEAIRPDGRSWSDHERAWEHAGELRADLDAARAVLTQYAWVMADACGVPVLTDLHLREMPGVRAGPHEEPTVLQTAPHGAMTSLFLRRHRDIGAHLGNPDRVGMAERRACNGPGCGGLTRLPPQVRAPMAGPVGNRG
jgi:hypothetical protein